jgi:anti-sigma regulatory factor (Ser/Thr protein kinase)
MKLLSEIRLPARLENLQEAVSTVAATAREKGLNSEKVSFLELAVEEAVVNICTYSYPAGVGDFDIRCLEEDGMFVTEIINYGLPFDITATPDPDVTKGLEERRLGGLGIFFIRKFVDEVAYRREGSANILRLSVRTGHAEKTI